MAADNDNAEPLPTPVAFSDLLRELAEAYGEMARAEQVGDGAAAVVHGRLYQDKRARACELYQRALERK